MQSKRSTRRGAAASAVLGAGMLAAILAGCGSSGTGSTGGSGGSSNGFSAAKGCMKVGILFPESNTSPRWEGYDHPDLVNALKQALPGVQIDYANAQGDEPTQINQADSFLTKGDCILVLAPHDGSAAAPIVTKAKQQGVPVVSYDRLVNSPDVAAYVSYNGVAVGQLQGQYIADHYQQYANGHSLPLNTIMIEGSQDDPNAHDFTKGAHDSLDPLFNSGKLKKVYETYTPGWTPATAETEAEAALTQNSNNIQIAYVQNDDMAGTVIQALKAQNLAGKVLVTGQDATIPGLQRILEGTQTMTVFKDYQKEANAAAQVVAALSKGTDISTIAQQTGKTTGGATVKADLLQPEAIDKSNIAQLLSSGTYVTKQQVCQDIPAGTDTGGVCS